MRRTQFYHRAVCKSLGGSNRSASKNSQECKNLRVYMQICHHSLSAGGVSNPKSAVSATLNRRR